MKETYESPKADLINLDVILTDTGTSNPELSMGQGGGQDPNF